MKVAGQGRCIGLHSFLDVCNKLANERERFYCPQNKCITLCKFTYVYYFTLDNVTRKRKKRNTVGLNQQSCKECFHGSLMIQILHIIFFHFI